MSEELTSLLLTMNVPSLRVERSDFGWLFRNLQIQNRDHPNFAEAMRLLRVEFNRRLIESKQP